MLPWMHRRSLVAFGLISVVAIAASGRGAEPAASQAVDTLPFVLGQPLAVGAAELLFTVDAKENLVVRCTAAEGGGAIVGQPVVVLLLDDADRLMQASQGTFAAGEDGRLTASAAFGHSHALGATARFAVAGLGDISEAAGAESRKVRVWRPASETNPARDAGIADASGKTRLTDVKLRTNADGKAAVDLHIASRDRMNEFQLDAAVAVFDDAGRLVAAAAKAGRMLVKSEAADETWEILLPGGVGLDEIGAIAIGFGRGQTISAPMGSMWGVFLDYGTPFSIDAMLAASDLGCWTVALRELEMAINEALDHGLLGSEQRWREQKSSRATPADLLAPRADRLLLIAEQARDPSTLAAALRLLGFSSDERTGALAVRLLTHDDVSVQDAAAVALGLLRRDEGLARLDAMLARSQPPAKDGAALIALATIRSDASVAAVHRWMRTLVDGFEVVETAHGSTRGGTAYQAEQLAILLGRLDDPRYLGILTEAVDRLEKRDDLADHRDVGEWLASILLAGDAAREFITPRVQRGDSATLYALQHSRDPHYIQAVRQWLDAGVEARAWHWAVGYLWNLGSPEAVDVLRAAYDGGVPAGAEGESARLRTATALAAHGDARGFPKALDVLIELALPGDPPAEKNARREWERQLDRRRDNALDVFDRANGDAVAELLAKQAADADLPQREALLQIVDETGVLPDAIRPHVKQWAADPASEPIASHAGRVLEGER